MSLPSAVIDAMVAAGCSAEQLAAAMKAANQQVETALAEKRARAAAKKRRQRANVPARPEDTEGHSGTVGDTPSPKEIPPTPPKEITPSPETANAVPLRKRATRLSLDWQLPKAWGDEAVAEGLTPEEVRSQAETMRDWSLSAPNGAKLDWHAAWRIWFRKAIKDRPQGRASPPPKASSSSALADSAARLVQSMRSENEIRSRSGGSGVPALIPHLPFR